MSNHCHLKPLFRLPLLGAMLGLLAACDCYPMPDALTVEVIAGEAYVDYGANGLSNPEVGYSPDGSRPPEYGLRRLNHETPTRFCP